MLDNGIFVVSVEPYGQYITIKIRRTHDLMVNDLEKLSEGIYFSLFGWSPSVAYFIRRLGTKIFDKIGSSLG